MAKILEFPSQRSQGLAYLEQKIRDMMVARGADEELENFAAQTLKSLYQKNIEAENYTFSLELPESIDDAAASELQASIETGLESIRSENHALVIRLVAELVLAEVRHFQLTRDGAD